MTGVVPTPKGTIREVAINVKDATLKECECGCKIFLPAVEIYVVSAIMSPTGQELIGQKEVFVCMECKQLLK